MTLSMAIYGQNKSSSFLDQVKNLEKYKESIDKKESWLESIKKDILNYDHINMITKDKKELDQSLKNINQALIDIGDSKGSFFISKAKTQIIQLQELENFQDLYETKKKRLKEIKSNPKNSKRLKKYIKFIEDGKYTQASIAKVTLFNKEKELASVFEDENNFIIRELNIYENNKKLIKDEIAKIKKTLSYPEKSKKVIDGAIKTGWSELSIFQSIKNAHKKPQYDVTIKEYESGLFNCKEQNSPQFLRYKNFPNLVALVTKGTVKSILNVNPNNPNEKDFAYVCQNFSTLGGCLENRKKEICKIQQTCAIALKKMEDSFVLNDKFNEYKNSYLDFNFKNDIRDIRTSEANPLHYWKQKGLLGNVDIESLLDKYANYVNYAKGYKKTSLANQYKHMSYKIKKDKKSALSKYSTNSKEHRALEYFYNSVDSYFKNLSNRDKLQDFVASKCSTGDFCDNFKTWDKATKIFDDKEEIENLTMDECPRLVLRFDNSDNLQDSYKCVREEPSEDSLKGIFELNSDSSNILKRLK